MTDQSRREFFKSGGFAVVGIGALTLRGSAVPTESSGDEDAPAVILQAQDRDLQAQDRDLKVTERDIEGPYFRAGAPYRAKITPPLAVGKVLLIGGRIWAFDSKQPIPGARIHIWQASDAGRYDNDDPRNPPKSDVFDHRARLVADEAGSYEYETIHPGRYKVGRTFRPSHIHYRVEAPGYKTLITQLYFKGDPYNKTDRFIKDSLIIAPRTIELGDDRVYTAGTFDIVLAKA